ncbi:FtsX-like permease family protein [Micromonospora andamanensis]|uniref:ABC transporter permease n=1 Tax=Micromonospora andamanensis TaxID=1287068 RepID=UPI001A4C383F|nr:ABC transporter permease [Micromonospora andamanensis]GIJ37026.1 ABC transporter permease [Micromonospora andamanensis]
MLTVLRRAATALTPERLGGVVPVLLGTAIVAASLLLLASGTPRVPDRFVGAAVVVRSPDVSTPAIPFAEPRPWSAQEATDLAQRLATLDGVTAAVPDHTFYAQPVRDGQPVPELTEGHGWASAALAPYPLVAGGPPTHEREVVVDRALGVPVGDDLTVLTATGPATWTVSGLVDAAALFVSDATAHRLAPGIRAIGLLGRPDVGAVAGTVGGAGTVLTGAGRGVLEPRPDARTRSIGMQVLTGVSALATFACVFVVGATFAFTVNQRRRELGLLRAVGATPRQIRLTVYREALVVGVPAALGGVLLGAAVAVPVGALLVDAGFQPPGYEVSWQVWPLLAGLGVGPLVALLGAGVAARRAGRVRPLEALRTAEVEQRPMTRTRWVAGLAAAAGAGVAGLTALATDDLTDLAMAAMLGTMALVLAATLLAPAVVPALVKVLGRVLPGVLGEVVRSSAGAATRRTAATAAPVLLTVTFAVFIFGNVQTTTGAYAAAREASIRAGAVLMPADTPGLTDAAVAAVAGTALLTTEAYAADTVLTAVGTDTARLNSVAARLSMLSGSTVALSQPDTMAVAGSTADRFGWTTGDTVPVTFADGQPAPLRVVAVVADGGFPGDLLLDRSLLRQRDPSVLASAVLLTGPPPQQTPPGAAMVDLATYAARADAEEDRLMWVATVLMVGVTVGYGALAVASTLALATVTRSRDLRLLRLAGATRRQVLFTVAAESALVVAIGALLGGVAALLALLGSVGALAEQAGADVDLVVPWPAVAAVVALCLTLALLASIIPALPQSRPSPSRP